MDPLSTLSRRRGAGLPLLGEAEEGYFRRLEGAASLTGLPPPLPFAITPHLLSLMCPGDPEDPIRRQFVPRLEELRPVAWELADPLGEEGVQPAPRLLHRYPDRVLLLVTDRCAAYCRYCFRRGFSGRGSDAVRGSLSREELRRAAAYVARRREVREVILSGGDPLLLAPSRLGTIFAALEGARRRASGAPGQAPPLAHRIHTRLPLVAPARITPGLVDLLAGVPGLRLVVQANHPRELAPAGLEALRRLAGAGLPLLAQGVLLRGVNDDARTLALLWRCLHEAGVRPYYLFQPDLARGTAHFRPDLERGLELFRRAVEKSSGLPTPRYALDLPGGGGKVELPKCRVQRAPGGLYRLECPGGRVAWYPGEEN